MARTQPRCRLHRNGLLKEWPEDAPPLLKLTAGGPEEVYFLRSGTFRNHHGGFLRIGDYIHGGKLFLRWSDKLFCYDVKAK